MVSAYRERSWGVLLGDVLARRVPVSAFWSYRVSLQREKCCKQIIAFNDESFSTAVCIDASLNVLRARFRLFGPKGCAPMFTDVDLIFPGAVLRAGRRVDSAYISLALPIPRAERRERV